MSSAASRLMPTLRRVVLAGTVADRTDGQLLGAFVADRDADAFAGLVRRHGPMVLGVCRRVTGDHTVADDAFQAVFIVLARRAAAVKPREQVGNWLYGVAYRTALKARMVLARRRSREKQVDVMPEPPVVEAAHSDWADLQPLIDEELARLPDKLRLPVVLCDLEGRAQRDVAKHLGVPPATLATRLATARRTLANRLTRRGVTLSGGALAGLLSVHGSASAVSHSLVHGIARAAEAVAGGNGLSTLVSAHAVQLSEGVMRMMLLSKLKTVAVTVLTALALTGGLGLGLVPAYAHVAGDEPAKGEKPAAKAVVAGFDLLLEEKLKEARLELTAELDDETFLRRLSLDVRGMTPTDVETIYFVADEDADKRGKVVVWMIDDSEVQAFVAKQIGVPAERVRLVRAHDTGDGKPRGIVIVVDADPKAKPQALAFSPEGKRLAVELTTTGRRLDVTNVELTARVAPNVVYRRTRVTEAPKPVQGFFELVIEGQPLTRTAEVTWLLAAGQEMPKPDARAIEYLIQDKATGKWVQAGDDVPVRLWRQAFNEVQTAATESDADFLKRVIKDARGNAPTALEAKYFAEDKDPKKREKLLDALLKEPTVAKRLGDDWKKKMLAANPSARVVRTQEFEMNWTPNEPMRVLEWRQGTEHKPGVPLNLKFDYPTPPQPPVPPTPATPKTPKAVVVPQPPKPPVPPAPQAEKFEKVVGELLAAKKSDAEMLEAVTLVVLGRLPTEIEKKLTLGLVSKAADRKAAWIEVAKALSASTESKSRPDVIKLKGSIEGGKDGVFEFKVVPGFEIVPPGKK